MKTRLLLLTLPAILFLCGSVAAQPTAPFPEPGAYIVNPSTLPFIPGSSILRQGGFSGLFHAGGNEFWTLTDRGPNVDFNGNIIFLAPSFQLRMFKIRLNPNGSVTIVDSLALTQPGGGPTSGLANPAPYNTGQISYDEARNILPDDDWGFDLEGILIAPDGTFWYCEEYAPGIGQVSPSGEIIRRVRPQPSGGLPDILKRRRPNRGCEGIAMTPNGKIYTIVQSGMENSYSGTDAADVSASQQTELLRLVEFDPASGATRMLAYMMDAGYPTGGSNIRRRDIKIGDMSAVNNNELLLIEHAERGNGNVKRVYKIDLRGATPITQEVFETSPGVFKSLEELSRAQVTSIAGLTPVSKTLLLDLLNPGAGNPSWPLEADKPEGMAILNSTTLVICNDNDFGVLSPNEDGNYIYTNKRLHSLVYHLSTPLNFALGSQAVVRQATTTVTSGSPWFVDDYRCIGEEASPLPMSVTNTGTHDVVIYGVDFFQLDTAIAQGVPAHPLKRTPDGQLIRSNEYSITEGAGTAPSSSNQPPTFPVVVAPGETWNFHLNFTPDRRGRRYVRAFLRSNIVGVFGQDPTDDKRKEGLLTVDLFGHGSGGLLTTQANYVFPSTSPGNFRDTAIVIHNRGECDLRISSNFLSVDAGDVDEFQILSLLPNSGLDGKDNYVIPPGGTDSILIRFSPKQQGSRRATINLRTNDSSLFIPGVTERGAAYIDLYGFGVANLRIRQVTLPPAVIGATSSEGTVSLENNSIAPLDIVRVEFGANANNELQGKEWPTFPKTIPPGGALKLGVVYTPKAGSLPGTKTVTIVITLSNGKSVEGTITVVAGTRDLVVTPNNLFSNVQVDVGEIARGVFVITNTGTLPILLGDPAIAGPNATNYVLGPVPRHSIEPGGQEFIEVTFKPLAAGASSGEVAIPSNAVNGPHKVTLGGTSTGTTTPGGEQGSAFGISRATGESGTGSLRIASILPQPARNNLRLAYFVPEEKNVRIEVYDMRGTTVRQFDAGMQLKGKHEQVIDLRNFPAGLYYIRLTVGTETITAPVVVAP